jgi:hypothetical protein
MREAAAEQSAVEVPVELFAHEARQRDRERAVVHRSVERLEVVADDLVERRSLGSAAFVGEARATRRDGQLDRPAGAVHASSSAISKPDTSPRNLAELPGCPSDRDSSPRVRGR